MITVLGKGATLEDLHKIKPTTPRNAGSRWKPIPHGELVDVIVDEVVTRGWQVSDQLFSTANAGADMAGALLVNIPGLSAPTGTTLALGILNNNARRKALRITVGATITCCTNGMCTGTILLNRIHDHTVDLVSEVEVAVDKYVVAAKEIPATIGALQRRGLTTGEASEILLEAGRRKLVGWAAIGRVNKEYRNPTYAEHGKDTSWALLNAFTYAARRNIAPVRQMAVYNEFRQLLPKAA